MGYCLCQSIGISVDSSRIEASHNTIELEYFHDTTRWQAISHDPISHALKSIIHALT